MEGVLVPEWLFEKRVAPGMTGRRRLPDIPDYGDILSRLSRKISRFHRSREFGRKPLISVDDSHEISQLRVPNFRISRLFSRFTGIWVLTQVR
jgi:hypothetical protein